MIAQSVAPAAQTPTRTALTAHRRRPRRTPRRQLTLGDKASAGEDSRAAPSSAALLLETSTTDGGTNRPPAPPRPRTRSCPGAKRPTAQAPGEADAPLRARRAVLRLADDPEAGDLQQPPREAAEARVVIDDQDSPAHTWMVARRPSRRHSWISLSFRRVQGKARGQRTAPPLLSNGDERHARQWTDSYSQEPHAGQPSRSWRSSPTRSIRDRPRATARP